MTPISKKPFKKKKKKRAGRVAQGVDLEFKKILKVL
jgi:hypothetical protein